MAYMNNGSTLGAILLVLLKIRILLCVAESRLLDAKTFRVYENAAVGDEFETPNDFPTASDCLTLTSKYMLTT